MKERIPSGAFPFSKKVDETFFNRIDAIEMLEAVRSFDRSEFKFKAGDEIVVVTDGNFKHPFLLGGVVAESLTNDENMVRVVFSEGKDFYDLEVSKKDVYPRVVFDKIAKKLKIELKNLE